MEKVFFSACSGMVIMLGLFYIVPDGGKHAQKTCGEQLVHVVVSDTLEAKLAFTCGNDKTIKVIEY